MPLTWNAFGGPMDLSVLLANSNVNRGEPGETVTEADVIHGYQWKPEKQGK